MSRMAVPPPELTNSAATIDNLPDEILSEVLLGVPTPAALVHAAAVSKRWRGVIAAPDGNFLHEYRARHRSSPFLGLYIPRQFGGLPRFEKADSIQFADGDDRRDLDLERAAAKAFNLSGLGSHPDWHILDCHNGRLLLGKGDNSLEVYNPLSCERILVCLPQDDLLPDYFSACLLQGHGDDASSFRVVSVQHIRRRREQGVRAVEYDSSRKTWKDHPWDWETLKNIEGNEQYEVMHAGNLIFCKYIGASLLVLDTMKMQFSVLPLPCDNNPTSYAIGEMEDGVCCLASVDPVGIFNTLHLRVWRLEKLDWKLEKEMQVKQVLGEHACHGHSYYKVRKVTNGIALLFWSSQDLHFIIDMKTLSVMDKFEFNNHLPAFPMQMPWPPTFSVPAVINSGTTEGKNPGAAARGDEVEGTETGAESEVEAVETSGENEDMAEDSHTKGDVAEEFPPPRCGKRATTVDPTLEDDEAEETRVPSRRCRPLKSGKCGDSLLPPPDHLRCARSDGKKWRCWGSALPTVKFCEYHYAKANKGKKLSTDGEFLAVVLQRRKNKRKGRKSIHSPVLPQVTTSVCQTRDLLNGPMMTEGDANVVTEGENHVCAVINSGSTEGKDPGAAARGDELEGTETGAESEVEAIETSGENEDMAEDSHTIGDAAEEYPPPRCRKRATTLDPTPEETRVPSRRRHQQKSGERGDSLLPLPDHLRCARNDGKKWRCSASALPTVRFCKYHYAKANKGKKVLAVLLQRQKNQRKGMKNINPPASPEATTSDCQNKDIPNGPMMTEDDAVEDSPPPSPPCDRRRLQELGECGGPPPDHLQCIRNDGKKWRCLGRALPTIRFCEYHYAKANKGKKLPADGEVLAVALQRLKNKRKARKTINSPVSPQATTSACQTRDLPDGLMATSPGSSGPAALSSPVTMKVVPHAMNMTKAVPTTKNMSPLRFDEGSGHCQLQEF